MRVPRLYTDQTIALQQELSVSGNTAHYLVNVLRLKSGRQCVLFNGDGCDYHATVLTAHKKAVTLSVESSTQMPTESPLVITLGICLIKSDRMDWLLQKATELGVTHIVPLWSAYTDVKIPAERLSKKHQHWQQVVVSACEQCGRSRVPTVTLPQAIDGWLTENHAAGKFVLHPYAHKGAVAIPTARPQTVSLLVGPEGGLSEAEVDTACQQGFYPLSLGPRILRAETAPLTALTLLQSRYGDLGSLP